MKSTVKALSGKTAQLADLAYSCPQARETIALAYLRNVAMICPPENESSINVRLEIKKGGRSNKVTSPHV